MKSNSLVLKELQRRQVKNAPQFFDGKFKIQEEFISNESKFKALFATRRFGKSYTGGLYMVKTAYENPGVSVVYIALTRESAKKIMFKDVLKPLNRKYKLGMKFNETTLTISMPNGSVLYLMGVDSSEDEKDKLLGQKYKLAIIDECASFNIDLRELVYGTLKPAMADLGGTVAMLGTPGNLTKSLFFDITTGTEPGWHVVKGDTSENPFMAENWRKEIAELTANQPYIIETPMFKQMYLGQWVIDTDALVYKFNPERNLYEVLPLQAKGSWQYILGVDLGYEDDSAFVVVAFHEFDKVLYIVDTFNRKKMDITDCADKIRQLKETHKIHKVVIDGANKQAVEEIQKRHQIPLIAADKTGKSDFIEIMNGELIQGHVKVQAKNGTGLIAEWQNLVWKEKKDGKVNKREENPACDNHLADACLYAWRYTYSYLGINAPKPKAAWGTPEWATAQVTEMEEAAEEYFRRQADSNDDDYI